MTTFRLAFLSLATVITMAAVTLPVAAQADEASNNFIVLYNQLSVPSDAAVAIRNAGGTLVYSYDAIGVVIATSASTSFADTLAKDSKVEGVSATGRFAVQLANEIVDANAPLPDSTPAPGDDPLSSNQWDMVQIHAPEARNINGGSPSVIVGDIDTGLDYTHPDLAANVDFANSVSCVGGIPNQDPAAWNDDNGHGTHTAGTIAAARNGIGIVGVAPNVKIAGIKAGNANGYFYPEAVVCSFMWAGSRHLDVTNNSYFADPWLFNCHNDPQQRAIWKAEQRAIRYAMQQGVTVVAAQGNENIDLSKRNVDMTSPDNGTPLTREVTNACVVIPVEIAGVIGVTANGNLMRKSYYSSYGVGVAQVVAPGGDSRYQRTAAAARGTVLSTYPGNRYAYAQGTSMAAPHVAGVAALAISAHGRMPTGALQALISRTADPIPCPTDPFDPSGTGTYAATCQGGDGYNGFYGHGQVNALSVVSP
jgi:subtilisin family serine protease